MMSLTDRHLDELTHDLWRRLPAETARYAALIRKNPRGVVDAAARAIRFYDRRAIVAIGEAVIESGLLHIKPLRRLGFPGAVLGVLDKEGRHASMLRALDSFSSVSGPDGEPSAKFCLLRARALAGLGRLEEAREAAAAALKLDPDIRHGRDKLDQIETLQMRAASLAEGAPAWRQLRRLTEAWLGVGRRDEAAKAIREHAPGLTEPAAEDYGEALALLELALPLVGPKIVLSKTPLLRPIARDDRLKALISESCIALGRPEKVDERDEGGRDLRLQRALAFAARGDLEEAVERLGQLSQKFREDLEVRAALAFHVGEHVLKQHPLALRAPGGPRRVFNLVPFNDEIAILKMHLAEMADFVDVFVIVESEVTFTGQPKPLHFAEHRHEFAAYGDKIRHLVAPGHPPAFHSPWARDFRQRDLAITALSGLAAPDDLVLLTDVDEIVAPQALEGFDGEFAGLRMATFRFFLNYRPDAAHIPVRRTGAVWMARHLQRFGSSYARFHLARSKRIPMVDNAGWHFTSMYDPARLVAKMNSYAHQERSIEWRDLDHVDQRLAAIRSGRFEPGWERAEIEALPAYVRERLDEFRALLI